MSDSLKGSPGSNPIQTEGLDVLSSIFSMFSKNLHDWRCETETEWSHKSGEMMVDWTNLLSISPGFSQVADVLITYYEVVNSFY